MSLTDLLTTSTSLRRKMPDLPLTVSEAVALAVAVQLADGSHYYVGPTDRATQAMILNGCTLTGQHN